VHDILLNIDEKQLEIYANKFVDLALFAKKV